VYLAVSGSDASRLAPVAMGAIGGWVLAWFGLFRDGQLVALRAPAHPDQAEVADGSAARGRLAVQLEDVVPTIEREPGVHRAQDAATHDHDVHMYSLCRARMNPGEQAPGRRVNGAGHALVTACRGVGLPNGERQPRCLRRRPDDLVFRAVWVIGPGTTGPWETM
jgi:hypothetical protein